MKRHLAHLGDKALDYCEQMGEAGIFLIRILCHRPRLGQTFPLLMKQLYALGVNSLPIILVSALFIGMVVALQGFNILNKFSATEELGQMVALSVVRELAPVITALLFAGRAGSALTAEIGLMKATEQLASMEMMGVDPIWRIISPRFWGGVYAMPLLTLLFSAVAIIGGHAVGVLWLGVDNGAFWNNMQAAVDFRVDVLNGVIKGAVFGFVTTWIAVFQGYACVPTAEGISQATTRTVVYASLATLGLDFVLTALMMGGW